MISHRSMRAFGLIAGMGVLFVLVGCPTNPHLLGPIAAFTATPTTGIAPLTVEFTDHSFAGSTPIASWLWSFGDGTTSVQQNPIHTYQNPGSYTVSLIVATRVGYDTERRVAFIGVDYNSVLSVTPLHRDVPSDAGNTTVSVSNSGTGKMDWSAEVISGDWLRISSGVSGTNSGVVNISYDDNFESDPRTGTIRITAVAARNNPQEVTVNQAPYEPPIYGYTAPISGVVPGAFTLTGGSFQLSVTPLDPDGNPFFDESIIPGNFTFSDMEVYSFAQPGQLIEDGGAISVGVEVVLPDTSGGGIAVPILLDSSGSMSWTDPNNLRKDAAKAFVDQLGSDDVSAVLDFGAGFTAGFSVTRLLQDMTNDKERLYAGIDLLVAYGGEPLYDSLCETLDWMLGRPRANSGLLVLCDGEDTSSYSCTMQSVIDKAVLAEIPVYPIGLGMGIDFTQLQQLAGGTGGTFASAVAAAGLQSLFENIGVAVTKGRCIVYAKASLTDPLDNAGKYIIRGTLTVNIKGRTMQSPLEFVIQVNS